MMTTSAIIACAGIASFAYATELKSLSSSTIKDEETLVNSNFGYTAEEFVFPYPANVANNHIEIDDPEMYGGLQSVYSDGHRYWNCDEAGKCYDSTDDKW